MCSAVMKGLRFANNTQETCFEAWKRSHIGCSAMLCGRFADSQKSRFQASKRSNMGSAVLDGGRSAYYHELFSSCKTFRYGLGRTARVSICDSQEWDLRLRKFQIRAVPSCRRVDLFMLRNSVFTVQNVEIWVVCPAMNLIC